jgi:signal transduction histidine kinase
LEEEKEYKVLLRDDVAFLRTYETLINYLLHKIVPMIGVNGIKDVLDNYWKKYPFLEGCYIGVNERLNMKAAEDILDKTDINEVCIALYDIFSRFLELYAAIVPWEEVIEELRRDINKAMGKNPIIFEWAAPIILFRSILEPVIYKCHPEDIIELGIVANSIKKDSLRINKNGTVDVKKIYQNYSLEKGVRISIETFLKTLTAFLPILQRRHKGNANIMITSNFRKMSHSMKERLYGEGFIEKLPKGILEEEKVTLMSREKLVEELVERRKKLEKAYKELAEAELGKMKATFIDVIAHELKTPLTAINTYAELLQKEKLGKLKTVQKEKLEIMIKNIKKLTDLIDDMLQIPSIDLKELELRKEKFLIKDLIVDTMKDCNEMIADKTQQLITDIPGSLTIQGDKNLLGKSLKNIVVNAIQYTPKKGKIKISAFKEGTNAHITIEDTGEGIPKDEIERIFEPFYRIDTEKSGAGLGLTIVKNIIEGHRGRVWAESTVGKGSSFHIILPRS